MMFQNLDVVPKDRDVTFLSDYIELKALIDNDKNFLKSDFENTFGENRDIASEKWNNALFACRMRREIFPKSYPFTVPDDEHDIIELHDHLDNLQKCYLSLLIFSCLKYFQNDKIDSLSREFEKMCCSVFEFCVPKGSKVKGNWPNPDSDDNCYTGVLADRLKTIAKDIRSTTDETTVDEQYGRSTAGDAGIDLVAWHEMFDNRAGIPIAMGQCSCSRSEWKLKPYESSHSRHQTIFPLIQPWLNFYFCPLDLWKDRNHWRMEKDVRSGIFMDRHRILAIMEENNHLDPPDVVEEVLSSDIDARC